MHSRQQQEVNNQLCADQCLQSSQQQLFQRNMSTELPCLSAALTCPTCLNNQAAAIL